MKGKRLLLMAAAGLHYVTFHTDALINVTPEESGPLDIYVEFSIFTRCFGQNATVGHKSV